MAEQLKQGLHDADKETANTQLLTDKFLLNLTKEELTSSKEVLIQNKPYITTQQGGTTNE